MYHSTKLIAALGPFLVLILMSQGCTQTPDVKRERRYQQTKIDDKQSSSIETETPSPVEDEANAEPTDDNLDEDEEIVAEENLPDYLFTLSEAMQIMELVESYIPTDFDMFEGATAAANREELRAYFQSFLGTMMMLQGLAPGRDLDVMVSDSNIPNASAAGQQIIVNEGMLMVANSKSLLGVICHEIAHSAKNHSQKSQAGQVFSDLDAFVQSAAFNSYMNAAYNGTTYTHIKADYDALRKSWDVIAKKPSDYSRRQESEADIVGGMICAHLGMSGDDFYQNQALLRKELEGAQGEIQSAKKLADGTQIPVSQAQIQDFVTQFLFPIESHPTPMERDAQIMRTKPAIDKFYDQESPLFTGFVEQLDQLNPALSLVGAQSIQRPFWYRLGCSHSHPYKYKIMN